MSANKVFEPQTITYDLGSHANKETSSVEVKLETERIEINLLCDEGKIINGEEVPNGYTRTVRIEVKNGTLHLMVYAAHNDDPAHYAMKPEDSLLTSQD